MPTKIDLGLVPPFIRESVDPEILNRAQSIEWSINRDVGEDEHGFVDGSHEDYLTSQNLMHKTHALMPASPASKRKQVDCWSAEDQHYYGSMGGGRDSGFEHGATPTSPSLGKQSASWRSGSSLDYRSQMADSGLSPVDESAELMAPGARVSQLGSMKRHPQGQHPFPIYKVNQEQLQGDVVFEAAPRAKPGERTVHYEKSTRVMNEEELNALGLDPNVFGPNSKTTMDEQEEELIETGVLKGGRRELEDLYNSMRTHRDDYFDRQRARSVSPHGSRAPIEEHQSETRKTVIFGSLEEINQQEQEYYPYRDAHQGKPLPGDNEYGTWGSRYDDQRQWKLCNGQWVRVAEPKPKPAEPRMEKYLAERVKCTILLEPIPPPIEEIKVEPITPTYVEMKKPLKQPEGEEEKIMEDPNLMWMHMGPAQYGPPLGTLRKRKGPEEEWVGPPCELCHKEIEERRCMLAENMKFHCWHFACSFCLKTLKPADFLIAEADKKPYCLNCHKREFPEIQLSNLKLEE